MFFRAVHNAIRSTRLRSTRIMRCSLVVVLSSAYGLSAHSQNLNQDQTVDDLNLDLAFADTKAILNAGGTADITIIGDSLSFYRWVPHFRDFLQTQYGDAGQGYQAFSRWHNALAVTEGWHQSRINLNDQPRYGLEGLWMRTDQADEVAYLQTEAGSVELQFQTGRNFGSFTLHEDSPDNPAVALVDSFSTSRDSVIGRYTHHFSDPTSPNQRLYIKTQDNDEEVAILGSIHHHEDTPGVRVHQVSNGGWKSHFIKQRGEAWIEQLATLDSDLVYLWLGENEWTYKNQINFEPNIELIVSWIKMASPDAEVVLVGTHNTDGRFDFTATRIAETVAKMENVAETFDLGFINLYNLGGEWQDWIDRGHLADSVHFNDAGSRFVSRIMEYAWTNEATVLLIPTPHPVSAGLLSLFVWQLQRRRRS